MGYEQEIIELRNLVQDLERQVEHLRTSRRVLMNLLEKCEREKKTTLTRLEKENKRLQTNNLRYARRLFKNNCRLVELQSKSLDELGMSNQFIVED
ncbi:MAG: translation initiation factor 2 [Peptococcia bacterium]